MIQRKRIIVIAAVIVILALGIGAGAAKLNDDTVETARLTEEQKKIKEKIQSSYNKESQRAVKEELEQTKSSGQYTAENMLIRYNPFGTNTQSLYVYFTTEIPVKVSCTIHAEGMEDFSQDLYSEAGYSTEHEYQIIGLIPDRMNELTFTMTAEDSTVYTTTKEYEMGSLLGNEELVLEQEEGESAGDLERGLYVILGNDSEELDFMYYYDNNGILRGEVPLLGYRSHRLIFSEDRMYYSISETKMAEVDRLGQVTNVYDTGSYELHHDYVFDDKGNLLILASDTESESDSVEDMIIKLDLSNGEITEVLDLADLYGEYKETCEKNSDGELDWMHINTIQWMGEDSVILSSRETSSILKISELYGTPKVDYMISDPAVWEGTQYQSLLLEKEGDFPNQAGQHSVTYVEDESLQAGQYYLYMFNNNFGYSESQPEFEWDVIEDVQTEVKKGDSSMFYKYLVDENTGTYELVEEMNLPFSAYVSSAQQLNGNIITDSGMKGSFGEYDSGHQLINTFQMGTEKFIYRVYKYDFKNFYFS